MQPFKRVHGNKEVCELLQHFLAKAEKGGVYCGAVVMMDYDNKLEANIAGSTNAYFPAYFAVKKLESIIEEKLDILMHTAGTMEAPPNRYVYDLAVNVLNFDFTVALVTADMIRRREGCTNPLEIAFVQSVPDEQLGIAEVAARKSFLQNVMVPAVSLIGGNVVDDSMDCRPLTFNTMKDIVAFSKGGEEVPKFRAPDYAREAVKAEINGKSPVVITLRECGKWEHRNSDMEAWLKFGRWLKDRGYHPIFVRDTAKAMEPLPGGLDTYPGASLDLHIRMALYERALCNCFVSNGPSGLAVFGDRPMLVFVTVKEDEPYVQNRPQWWRDSVGIEVGEQLPWLLPSQRFVWEDDSWDNIRKAWDTITWPNSMESGMTRQIKSGDKTVRNENRVRIGEGAPPVFTSK